MEYRYCVVVVCVFVIGCVLCSNLGFFQYLFVSFLFTVSCLCLFLSSVQCISCILLRLGLLDIKFLDFGIIKCFYFSFNSDRWFCWVRQFRLAVLVHQILDCISLESSGFPSFFYKESTVLIGFPFYVIGNFSLVTFTAL